MLPHDMNTGFSSGFRLCFADCEDNVANNHSAGSNPLWPLSAATAPVLPIWHCPQWSLQHHGALYGRFVGVWDVTNAAGAILRVVPASAVPSTPTTLAAATGLNPAQLDFNLAATVDGYFTLEVWVDIIGSNAGSDLQKWTVTLEVITPGTAVPTYKVTQCAITTITQLEDHDIGVLLTVPTGTVNADSRVRSCWGCHYAQRNGT